MSCNVNAFPCLPPPCPYHHHHHKCPKDSWSRDTFLPTADKHDPLGSGKALNEFFILRAFHSIRS